MEKSIKKSNWITEHTGTICFGGLCLIVGVTYGTIKGYSVGRSVGGIEMYYTTLDWIKETLPDAYKMIDEWFRSNPDALISEEEAIQILMSK